MAIPSTAAITGLVLCAREYRNLIAFDARGFSPLLVPSLRKSSRSLPAVNTPEPPVMMMQRTAGLFCAVSIASLIARYMSCVIAFFFCGRRSVITRVASSSVTIRCSVMAVVLQMNGGDAAGESDDGTLHHLRQCQNRDIVFRR